MHSTLALPQGLVPPGPGSMAGAEQTPGLSRGGRGVSPHCSTPAKLHHSPCGCSWPMPVADPSCTLSL